MKPLAAAVLASGLPFFAANDAELLARDGPLTLSANNSQPLMPSQIGKPGQVAYYGLEAVATPREGTVTTLTLGLGAVEHHAGKDYQSLVLEAAKANGRHCRGWLLTAAHPVRTTREPESYAARYMLQ